MPEHLLYRRHQVLAYIGLGSNLAGPRSQVLRALTALAGLPDTELATASSLYHSAPMGPANQPDYINAVAAVQTALGPLQLLDALQAIEHRQRRIRSTQRWGPRTLDLDLLLYGQRRLHSPRLTVPHYGMHERAFVLYPLAEIAPDVHIPGKGPLSALLADCPAADLRRLATQRVAQRP